MSEDFKPKDLPTLIPYLSVKDAEKTMHFYEKAFGFKARSEPMRDEKGKIGHCEMVFHDAVIMFAPEGGWSGIDMKAPKSVHTSSRSLSLYVYCPDVDALYKQAIAAGATKVAEPQDAFWGDRYCALEDIDGHQWTFGTALKK